MALKKIGDYLIERTACDEQAVRDALKKQTRLKDQGIYQPVGRIIVEKGCISYDDLQQGLKLQIRDMLHSVELFRSLPDEIISRIAGIAECIAYPAGETIIHEGEQGDAFYQVISGLIRVFHVSEDGIEITLAKLGPGEAFGEMALLTGEPRSASVDIVETGSLVKISKKAFDQLAADIPDFPLILSRILSKRLQLGTSNFVKASSTEKAFQRFLGQQSLQDRVELVGTSKLARRLKEKISDVARTDNPVWITGEEGTEKNDAARLIHLNSSRKGKPFLEVDVKSVSMGRIEDKKSRLDPVRLELAQASTLFGHADGALSFAPESRIGLLQAADGGTVVLDNIEHLLPNIQKRLVNYLKKGCFQPVGSQNFIFSSIRIIALTSADPMELKDNAAFDRELYDLLIVQKPLKVPPLCSRKKDLGAIAGHLVEFYSDQAGKAVAGIDEEAYKDMMAYDWPGNADELKSVIRRAVNLTSNSRLTAGDILIGTAPQFKQRFRFNLLKFSRIRSMFIHRYYPGLFQLMTALFFVGIIVYGLFGPQDPKANLALELTWGIWEPLAVLSCILAARIWCAVCPVGALTGSINRRFSINRNVPPLIRNYGIWFAAAGIGVIILSEIIFDMLSSPRATAVMILSIFLPAVVLSFVYRRRIWCRFLCPLGRLLGFMSRCAPMELRANYNICNNDCRDHYCYLGDDQYAGCPVFEAPFVLSSNQECILCGNCIKTCPHQSPVLNLRVPGQELWSFRKPDPVLYLLASFIMGTQIFRGLEKTGLLAMLRGHEKMLWQTHTLLILICSLAACLLIRMGSSRLFHKQHSTGLETLSAASYLFIPLIAGFELGWHFERFIRLGGRMADLIGSSLGMNPDYFLIHVGPGFIKGFQIFFILAGMVFSNIILNRLIQSRPLPVKADSRVKIISLMAVFVFYVWVFVAG